MEGKERIQFAVFHAGFVLVLAALRLYLDFAVPNFPVFSDAGTYELFALELYNGDPVTLPVRPLGYPLFLAIIYKVFGPSRDYAVYAQQAIGVLGYFLYYMILREFFKGRSAAAVLAFVITLAGAFIFYERMLLSDFLNHFFILLSAFIFLKYLKTERTLLLVPLAVSVFCSYLIRPNSSVLALFMAVFIFLKFLINRPQGWLKNALKDIAIFSFLFIVFTLLSGPVFRGAFGFRGRPVGVTGATVFSRVAPFIEYTSPLLRDIKTRFKEIRLEYNGMDIDPFAADLLATYRLMTEIECPMPDEVRENYKEAAGSAEKYYGAHGVGSGFFNIHDILREAKCPMEEIDALFLDMSKEAILNNPGALLKTTALNVFDYISLGPSGYFVGISEGIERSGGPVSPVLYIYASIGRVTEDLYVNALFLAVFLIGGAVFFLSKESPMRLFAAFLAVFTAFNYVLIGSLMSVLTPRYKLPSFWMEVFLFVLFASTLFKRVLSVFKGQGLK